MKTKITITVNQRNQEAEVDFYENGLKTGWDDLLQDQQKRLLSAMSAAQNFLLQHSK